MSQSKEKEEDFVFSFFLKTTNTHNRRHTNKMAADNQYKAIRVEKFGDVSVLGLKMVDEGVLGEDEVSVKLYAVGVNPVDTYIRSGAYNPLPVCIFCLSFCLVGCG